MSLLEVEAATKSFGSLVAIDNVSMQVAAGELRAIIGPASVSGPGTGRPSSRR